MSPDDLRKAIAYNAAQMAKGNITAEMAAVLVAGWQASHGLAADGACGPATQASLSTAMIDATASPPAEWPPFDGPLERVPQTRREVYEVFGNPGVGSVDGAWQKANIVTIRDLPGVPGKWYFETHRLIEPYLREGLRRARLACPDYQIVRAASFVFRHQRHDPKRPLSYHSWGIAADIDADLNFAKTYEVGSTPVPWGEEWKATWPKGLPKKFVEAMESVGFTWGGRWKGFVDAMHFEFVGSSVPV